MTRSHLLIVANDSDFGRRALHMGESIALEKGWDIAVLSTEVGGQGSDPRDLLLDKSKLEAAGVSITMVPPSATIHDAGDQAIAYAQDQQPALIVLGIRRRSRVGKLIMGSVAQKILLEVDCPVLVVKAAPDA